MKERRLKIERGELWEEKGGDEEENHAQNDDDGDYRPKNLEPALVFFVKKHIRIWVNA